MMETCAKLFKYGTKSATMVRSMSSIATTKFVDLNVNDKTGIATLTFNRPPVNSLNQEFLDNIVTALDETDKNKYKGLILTSSSNKVFTAGLDIMELYQPKEDQLRKYWTTLQEVWIKLYGSSYPTAAAINGHSPAGGCLLAMSCEYRVMLPNCVIGLNETQLGIMAPKWVQQTMLSVIPRRNAEYALTVGKLHTTDEALKINLIDDIATDKAEAIAKCEQFINEFNRIPSFPRAMTKQMLRFDLINDLKMNRKSDTDQFWSVLSLPETQKILENYLENLKGKK